MVSLEAGLFVSFIGSFPRDLRLKVPRGTSIQWALPLVPQLLPDDLYIRFRTTAVDPLSEPGYSMPTYNGHTGEVLKVAVSPFPSLHILCDPFLFHLSITQLKQYGKCLLSANATSAGVEVSFRDGTTAIGSVLVGADGARSTTRNSIYVPELGAVQEVPYKALNMHVHYNDAAVSRYLRDSFIANKTMAIAFHPRGYWLWLSIQDVPDESRPETWIFQLQWTWPFAKQGTISSNPVDTKVTLVALKKIAEECFGEPYRTAWLKIPEGTPVYESKISIWSPVPTPSDSELLGRSALVGDAAHAMSFHRGQGLNHGIADAISLVDQLKAVEPGSKGLEEAIGDYESRMSQWAGEEVKQGKMNTEMVHDWGKLMDSPFIKIGGARN